MSLKGLRFTLEVAGKDENTFAVVSFELRQGYSRVFTLEVDVASTSFGQTADMLLEKEVTLTLWQGNSPVRCISGVVAAFRTRESNHWQMQYSLSIRPPLWRSGLRQNFRHFQQQDIQGISALLLEENGITGWKAVLYESHPAREFCVQYGETDLAFLIRLWAEEGILFFNSMDAEQTLTLTDDVAALPSAGELPFNPNLTDAATGCISAFSYQARVRPSSVQMQDYTFKVPDWPGRYDQAGEHLNGQRQQYEIYDYPGRYKDEQHGADFARYRMDGWRWDAETATGTSNSPVLWPGVRFGLTGHPTSALNREWQVVSSLLSGNQPQALHGSQDSGTTLTNQFSVIPADRTWRMPPRAKPRVDGPQSAVVTGPEGEEIFCDEHGRIRVKFIWDRYHGCTEDSSCWIRVSQAWAGAGFGNLAIPRVGQEVIVDFLNGDPDQPVVMGRTYHEDNRPPGDLPLTKTQMTVRSKTYKGSGFNELTFEDATGQERVYLHAQKDMDTEVLNNRSTDVKVDHMETIGHDQKISVVHDQGLAVQNDQTVSVRHDRMANISHNDGLYVANDRKITVDGTQHHKTSGDHISLVTGKYSLQVNSDLAQKISGALGIKVQGEMVQDSASKITLKVGSSFVVISPSGVDISAPVINLNSGGSPGSVVQTVQPAVLKALEEEGQVSAEDSAGKGDTDEGPEGPEPPSDTNHMLSSLKGVDGIESTTLVYNPLTNGDKE